MAKLLKHLGIGGKKTPPHPPKPDYGAQKSSSVQELLTKSPTRDRSTLSLATGSSHTSDFETASLTDSPHHRSHHSLAERVGLGFGGARPKEPRNLSPKSATLGSERRSTAPCAFAGEDDATPAETEEETPKVKKKPQMMDEYSDPFDLKKQIADTPELLGAYVSDTPGVTDDDYSVPYEVKKLIREMKQSERENDVTSGLPGSKDPQANYDDPFDENATNKDPFTMAAMDRRPREDYDEPWEWAAKQSALLQAQMENSAAGQESATAAAAAGPSTNKTPLMTPKKAPKDSEDHSTENGPSVTTNHCQENETENYTVSVQNGPKQDGDAEDDGYTHLYKEGVVTETEPEAAAAQPQASKQSKDTRTGNYEEPWDLFSMQKDLEDKIKAVSMGDNQQDATSPSNPQKQDSRPMEGYEKPWDWKPDRKDDRTQEGYEKPWDWKPHQKDDRPTEEYEEPWDKKNKALEEELRLAGERHEGAREGTPPPGGTPKPDERPSEEYEEPWDQRRNKVLLGRTGSDGPAPASQSPQRKSGRSNHEVPPSWPVNMVGELVDPKLPLDQQGWYHGSISRVDAEALLRVHKEGSYLVRMSESNKLDFSLSLKSARGFMHMKITNRDGRFILGQFSQPFASIPLMIHHYSISKLPIKGAEHMSLLHPIIHEELL